MDHLVLLVAVALASPALMLVICSCLIRRCFGITHDGPSLVEPPIEPPPPPMIPVTQRTLDETRLDKTDCAICLAEYEAGEQLGSLRCGHKFHAGCISTWLGTHPTCPICRAGPEIV